MSGPVRVGIIGANPDKGWAQWAHFPALAAIDDVEVIAVATTRAESARAAAERWGAPLAFGDPAELLAHPDVEVVTVSVKVMDHEPLVRAALEAGKHVFCEWPLGRNTAEAVGLADLAAERGRTGMIGLQARRGPLARWLKDLLADGYLGTVASVTVSGVNENQGGPTITSDRVWTADIANGCHILSITTGHVLDTVAFVVGDLVEVSGVVATRFDKADVTDTGETVSVTSPDQVAIAGTTAEGRVVSVHMRSGVRGGPGLVVTIHGSDGRLDLTFDGGLVSAQARLVGTRRGQAPEELSVPARYRLVPDGVPEGAALPVAHLYRDLVRALRDGVYEAPDFAHAVRHHRLLDAVATASATGQRQPVPR